MLSQLLIFLPCSVCIAWVLAYSLLKHNVASYKRLRWTLLFAILYFFTDSCYEYAGASTNTLAITQLLGQFAAPCMLPFMWAYLASLKKETTNMFLGAFWISAPVTLLVSSLLLYAIMGLDGVHEYLESYGTMKPMPDANNTVQVLQVIISGYLFRLILLLEVITFALYVHKSARASEFSFKEIWLFAKGKGKIDPINLQYFNFMLILILCVIKVFFIRSFLVERQWIAIIMGILSSGVITLTAFFALFTEWKRISLALTQRSLIPPEMLSYSETPLSEEEILMIKKVNANHLLEEDHEPSVPESVPEAEEVDDESELEMPSEEHHEALLAKFEEVMIGEQKFLTPGITINDIAQLIGSNKTYVSRLVNSTFKMAFPDYLNNLRIDYAEEYILHHKDAKQSEIAEACGFPNASAFNNTFKKFTGMTPRIWLMTHDVKKKNN